MSQIQAGRYLAEVTAATVSESKTKGTPGVFLTFQLDGGGTIDGQLWLSEAAFERAVQTLREAFGFDDNFDTIEGQCVGKRCSITVEMEADQKIPDKFWPRVKWINPEREAPKAVDGNFLSMLSAKAARLTRSAPPAASSGAAPAQRPPAAPRPDPVKKDGDPF